MNAEPPPAAGVEAGDGLAAEVLRLLRSTYGPSVLEPEGRSAGLYALAGHIGLFERRYRNPVLVASIASAAEWLALARALQPSPSTWEALGAELVAAGVNEVLVHGALPLFFLSHLAPGKGGKAVALQVVKGLAKGCRQADCALLKSSVEPADSSHALECLHLTGFAVGMVGRERMLNGCAVGRPGDLVLGLAASGIQGCGLRRAREVLVEGAGLTGDAELPELGCSLAEELLRPSRIYARAVRALLERYRVKGVVRGVANVAREGLVGSLRRVVGRRCVVRITRAALPPMPLFQLIQRLGKLGDEEMFSTFNMGVGMAAVVAPFYADAATRRIQRAGERAAVIGEIVRGDGPAVEFV